LRKDKDLSCLLVLANIGGLRIVRPSGGVELGDIMKRLALVAAFIAALPLNASWAAGKEKSNCYSANAIEAEEAIRYITDLMVVSSACRDTTYAEFRLRNRDAIIGYQKAMITHFHGNAAFDKWNTSLANVASQKQAGMTTTQVCQQQANLLKQASAQDSKAFRAFIAAQAVSAGPRYAKCGKGK
jgi:hypothetical protein